MSSQSSSKDATSKPIISNQAKTFKVLTVRTQYADVKFPLSLKEMNAGNKEVRQFFADASYGKATLEFYHHPHILTAPGNRNEYNSDNKWFKKDFYNWASNAIAGAGYVKGTDYDFLHVFFPQTALDWGGLYFGVGSDTSDVYINTNTDYYREFVVVHETGHIFGLPHAHGLIGAKEEDIIGNIEGAPEFDEYGDKYDIMGDGLTQGTLNIEYKRRLGWVTPKDILTITKSGTYKIYSHDTPIKPKGPIGIIIKTKRKNPTSTQKNNQYAEYLLEYRTAYKYTNGVDINSLRGVGVRLLNFGWEGTLLVDMHPEKGELKSGLKFYDSTLNIGEKYVDELDNKLFSLEVLSVNEGVWDHKGYVEVKVDFLR